MANIKRGGGYSANACVKPNNFAQFGSWVYDKTDDGFGVMMLFMLTIFLAVGGLGGAAGLDSAGHLFWSWVVFIAGVIPFFVNLTSGIAILYAKFTALEGVRWSALDDAQEVYFGLPKSDRQIVEPLMEKMYECVNDGDRFDKRSRKFYELVGELGKHRVVTDDTSDLIVADEMLKLLRQNRREIER